jgi:biopolymer transport protein ExbD/biopolymer transport protein TolR
MYAAQIGAGSYAFRETSMAILGRNKVSINSNINVTPMVDVMLVLLIIFMVITPMLTPGVPVKLAQTNNPAIMSDADKEDALVIAVLRDGRIFLGNELVSGHELINKVKDRLAGRNNNTVYVRADARARYEYVVDVVDHVRTAGVDQLGLLTEQVRRSDVY